MTVLERNRSESGPALQAGIITNNNIYMGPLCYMTDTLHMPQRHGSLKEPDQPYPSAITVVALP